MLLLGYEPGTSVEPNGILPFVFHSHYITSCITIHPNSGTTEIRGVDLTVHQQSNAVDDLMSP